jgi:hypothetical protein
MKTKISVSFYLLHISTAMSNYQKTIENGVDICLTYNIGWSAVHAAVQEHNANAIKFSMLEQMSNRLLWTRDVGFK